MSSRTHRFVFSLALSLAMAQSVGDGQSLVDGAKPPVRLEAEPLSPYLVRTWTTRDGLPDGQINAIVQTRDGYLWLATYAGLTRFDGLTFETFTAGNSPGFVSDRLQTLVEDRDGTLWIGTEGRGVFMLRDGQFSVPSWNAQLADLTVLSLATLGDRALWIATDGGATRVDVVAGKTVATYGAAQGLPDGAGVYAVFGDREGTVWLGTSLHGLFQLEGDRMRPAKVSVGTPDYVAAFAQDPSGHLWVATSDGLFDIHDGRATRVPLPNNAIGPRIGELVLDDAARLWIGSIDGLCRVDRGDPTCFGARDGLAPTHVQTIFIDREKNVWLAGPSRGLQRLTARPVSSYVPAGVPSPTFGPLVSDGADGLWIGSLCNGLWRLRGGHFEQYQPTEGMPTYCVGALHRDTDGTLWAAGSGEGVIRVRDGRVTVFADAGRRINAIARDASGVLWSGSNEREALARMTSDGTFVRYAAPVEGAAVQFIGVRRAGGLWLGTTAGLFVFENDGYSRPPGTEALSTATVRAVLEDPDGTLWIATYGLGLWRSTNGRTAHYTVSHGLRDQELSWVVDDGRGYLWVGGTRGIARLERRELDAIANGQASALTVLAYDDTDGMGTRGVSGGGQPAAAVMRDGRIWFSTATGVAAVDPDVRPNAVPPPIVVTSAIVDGDARTSPQDLQLQAGARALEVHYEGLSYTAPQKVAYKYRLGGYDPAWIDAGARRVAYYTGLPPGEYRFEVLARNESGVWSTAPAVVPVRQLPFFYQTAVFHGLAILALIVAGVSAYQWRIGRVVRHATDLEQRVAARTRQLSEANEALAAGHEQIQKAHQDAVALLDQTLLGVVVIDRAGRVTFLSSVARNVLGCAPGEGVGESWRTLLPLSPADCARVEGLLAEPVEQRKRVPVRFGRDESPYWMEIDARDDPGDPSRRILYLHDVTELFDLQRLLGGGAQFQGLIGETTAMRLLYRQIRDVAAADATVIVDGETGTGKELVARAIHTLSGRKDRPFVAVNCAALTESILTSQLFGHRRGAFTGAVTDQIGLFEAADRGTLLLDEIGDVSPAVQGSLLRVLQEREIVRIGESRPRPIDVRVIAATHRNLHDEVAAGRFRRDLFYRLRVVHIHVPALRERVDDLPVLVAWFLGQARAAGNAQAFEVSRAAMDLLLAHDWPGNVRELKSVVESAALAAKGTLVEVADLPAEFVSSASRVGTTPGTTLDARDRDHVLLALQRTHGNRAAAARLLGISRNTLYRRLRELNLDLPPGSGDPAD